MEIIFEEDYLRELYYEGKAHNKKYRFQPQQSFIQKLLATKNKSRYVIYQNYQTIINKKQHYVKLRFWFYPTHPGEVLKEELEERGISQRKFAESIGMGYSVLNEILNGKRPVTTTSALMFEAALDIPADSLLKLQMKYNMHTARKDNALVEKLKQIRKVAAIL